MLRSWKLGKLFGIDVYVHWTFLLLVLYMAYSRSGDGISAMVSIVALLCAAFGCVLLHECGHALMARRFGIPTLDITLYPIGGVARLARLGEKPWEEFWIAVAGPAVNVAIAGVLGLLLFLLQAPNLLAPDNPVALFRGRFAVDLFLINVGLVLFNMLPAFPMDGGRVLRALLSSKFGRLRATEIAAGLGTIFAIIFVVVGFHPDVRNPMLILVGGFAYIAGRQELWMVRQAVYSRRARPAVNVPVSGEIIDISPTAIHPGFSGVTWDPRTGVWTFWKNGQRIRAQWHDSAE
jgi:Zn-dependent protease